ncbi:MAG: PIN domain-containing protein [Sphingomonadaceae bacterium]
MSLLIDTNIAIHVRDGDAAVLARYSALASPPAISVVTLVELAGGLLTGKVEERRRRALLLEALLESWAIVDFNGKMAEVYQTVVASTGFSRPRVLDRMIAATAIATGMPLATINTRDFLAIPGLQIEDWSN